MENALNNGCIFLINTLADIFVTLFLIRLILVALRENYFNPVSQVVIRFTQRIIVPIRHRIPNIKRIETASVLIVILLEIVRFSIISPLLTDHYRFSGVFILSLADTFKTLISIYFYAIIMSVLLSWLQPKPSPIGTVLFRITSPLLQPARRYIPPVGGLDISPIPVLILLQLCIILFLEPLRSWGLFLLMT